MKLLRTQRLAGASHRISASSRRRVGARSAGENGTGATATMPEAQASGEREPQRAKYVINEIPQSRWEDGVPAVMGAHLMPSGNVAPISTSKGPGDGGLPHMFQYHSDAANTEVAQFSDFDAAAKGLVAKVAGIARQAIEERGAFALALSGGSLPKGLSHFAQASDCDFSKWWIFYVDERNVPHDSDDSTHKACQEHFLSRAGIPESQVFAIREGLGVREAATNYEGRMLELPQAVLPRNDAGMPVLDCILLGTGPDGHIASLFPNSAQLAAKEGWILGIDNSPKPPKERITFTLPAVNAAKACIFLVCGEGKADVVHRALECQALPGALPAQMVRPQDGSVTWLVDIASSKELEIAQWENKRAYPRSNV